LLLSEHVADHDARLALPGVRRQIIDGKRTGRYGRLQAQGVVDVQIERRGQDGFARMPASGVVTKRLSREIGAPLNTAKMQRAAPVLMPLMESPTRRLASLSGRSCVNVVSRRIRLGLLPR